jgi:tape measure domain-containing protein
MNGVVSEMMIRIAADTAQLRSEMNEAKRAVGDGFEDIKSSASNLKSTLVGIFAAIGVGALVKQFVEVADSMSQLDARLKLATGSSEEFRKAQADIYRIAQQNSIGLEEVAALYTKLNDPVKRLGGTSSETAAIVEAFSLSLKVGGASAQEASAATLQFAQAMGSGKLQGDEFRSMAEASPRFMKALADGMGVPVEKLKEMGSEGKLTADVVGNALMKALGDLRNESQSLPDTVSGAFTRIKNDILQAIGELNANSGLTLGLAGLIEMIRTDILPAVRDELSAAFEAVGGWISENRAGLAEVWGQVKLVGGEVWSLVKAFGSVLGFVAEVVVQSGALKIGFESVRLIVAGIKDGMDIVVATFSLMGAQILKVLGVFSASAKAAAAEAQAAGLAVFQRFANGDTEVQKVVASINGLKVASAGATAEQARAVPVLAANNEGFRNLKSSVSEATEEQKKSAKEAEKAKAEYEKLMRSISDKTGLLIAESQQTEKLTDGQRTALKVMQDIQSGTLRLTDEQKRNLAVALDQYLQQEKSNIATRTANELTKKRQEEIRKATDAQIAEVTKLEEGNEQLAEQNLKLRIGDAAFRERQIRLLELQADELEWKSSLDGGNAALAAQARALRERAGLLQEGGVLEAAKNTATEWQKTADSIQQGLTDSLFRAAESGKGFFESLKDGIKGMFNNLVLRPVINAVMAPIAGGLTSMLGMGSANASTGGGGGMDILGLGANLASMGGLFGAGGLSGALMGGAGWLTGATSFTGALTAAGSLIGTGTAGGIMSGLAMGAGALGPIALGIGALIALSGGLGGETRSGSSYGYSAAGGNASMLNGVLSLLPGVVSSVGGPSGGPIGGSAGERQVTQAITGTIETINSLLAAMGSASGVSTFYGKLESSENGRGGVLTGGSLTTGGTFGESGFGSNYIGTLFESGTSTTISGEDALKAFALDLQQVTIQALQAATDIPQSIRDMIEGVDAEALSEEAVGGLLSSIAAVVQGVSVFRSAVEMMPFENLKGLSFDAAAGLVKLAGGIENLLGQIQTYYENFYTEIEQAGITAQQALAILEEVGISGLVVENRQEFRSLFESLDANTEAGREQIAAMLQVAGAMASVFSFLEQQGEGSEIDSIQELIAASPQVTVLESMLTPAETTAAATESIAEASGQSVSILTSIDTRIAAQNAAMSEVNTQMVRAIDLSTAAIQGSSQAGESVANASNQLVAAANRLADSVALVSAQPTFTTDIGAT